MAETNLCWNSLRSQEDFSVVLNQDFFRIHGCFMLKCRKKHPKMTTSLPVYGFGYFWPTGLTIYVLGTINLWQKCSQLVKFCQHVVFISYQNLDFPVIFQHLIINIRLFCLRLTIYFFIYLPACLPTCLIIHLFIITFYLLFKIMWKKIIQLIKPIDLFYFAVGQIRLIVAGCLLRLSIRPSSGVSFAETGS